MKVFIGLFLFIISWSYLSLAQGVVAPAVPAASVAAQAAVVAAPSGVMGWIESHGGFQAAVLLLVSSFNTILSALRIVLKKFDGVAEGDPIPADKKALTLVNKLCIILGQILDFSMGNVKH